MAEETNEHVYGHCPQCGPKHKADVLAEEIEDRDERPLWWHTSYRILQCGGCEAIYFQTIEVFSEDELRFVDSETGEEVREYREHISYWPVPSRRGRPNWGFSLSRIDDDLLKLFEDIYTALDNDLGVLAAIGIRTVFDRASELQGIDPTLTFADKLNGLLKIGNISPREKEALDVLVDAGSAAAHRGWRPSPKDLDIMMSHLEFFLYRSFVQGRENNHLSGNIPPRPPRQVR